MLIDSYVKNPLVEMPLRLWLQRFELEQGGFSSHDVSL
jgi:hypothetical protein